MAETEHQNQTLSVGDLKPDPRNARRHTPGNVGAIEQALHEVGAARSIVIDEDGTVLAGNATIAVRIGLAARSPLEERANNCGEVGVAVENTVAVGIPRQRLHRPERGRHTEQSERGQEQRPGRRAALHPGSTPIRACPPPRPAIARQSFHGVRECRVGGRQRPDAGNHTSTGSSVRITCMRLPERSCKAYLALSGRCGAFLIATLPPSNIVATGECPCRVRRRGLAGWFSLLRGRLRRGSRRSCRRASANSPSARCPSVIAPPASARPGRRRCA